MKIVTQVIDNLRLFVRSQMGQIKIDRPVFIIGLQGGGLSIITRILRRTPNTVSVKANTKSWFSNDEMQNEVALELPEGLRLFHCMYYNQPGFFRGGWLYGTNRYFHHFRKSEKESNDEIREQLLRVIEKLVRKYAIKITGARFIDKSQSYGLKIPFLNQILAQCRPKFLVISRNPYIAIRKAILRPAISFLGLNSKQAIQLASEHYNNCMTAMYPTFVS